MGALTVFPASWLRIMPKWAWVALGGVFLVAAFWIALTLYGNARYNAGVTDTDAKWAEASRRLENQARAAGTRADTREAERIEDHAEAVADERERLDEAIATGSSPLDVLFGN